MLIQHKRHACEKDLSFSLSLFQKSKADLSLLIYFVVVVIVIATATTTAAAVHINRIFGFDFINFEIIIQFDLNLILFKKYL